MNKDIFFWTLLICPIFTFGQQGISVISSSEQLSSTIGLIGHKQWSLTSLQLSEGIQQAYPGVGNDNAITYDILHTTDKIINLDVLNDGSKASIVIATRDGVKVYENSDYKNDWRGTNNQGTKLPDGVYYFWLTVEGRPKPVKGSVTLLR